MMFTNAKSTAHKMLHEKRQGDVRQRNNRWFGVGLFSINEGN